MTNLQYLGLSFKHFVSRLTLGCLFRKRMNTSL